MFKLREGARGEIEAGMGAGGGEVYCLRPISSQRRPGLYGLLKQ